MILLSKVTLTTLTIQQIYHTVYSTYECVQRRILHPPFDQDIIRTQVHGHHRSQSIHGVMRVFAPCSMIMVDVTA